jgi:hypothetical protein
MMKRNNKELDEIFEATHAEGTRLWGTRWLSANEAAVHAASVLGFDYTSKEGRVLVSRIALSVMKRTTEQAQ